MAHPISKEEAYARLGSITREMHEALAVLGGHQLNPLIEEIPNARDRLAHVGKLTEDAANKVLGLVEAAKPQCDDLSARGVQLSEALNRMATEKEFSVETARGLMLTCSKFALNTAEFASSQGAALGDIMMAQDFQDLSGQVIKKVIDIITRTELQLVQLLIDSAPTDAAAPALAAAPATVDTHTLHGPQTADKALQQEDVDDLLASLGF